MTHPDILKMERDGFLGSAPRIMGVCMECGEQIEEGDTYYEDSDGGVFCSLECVLEHTGIKERIR